MDDPKSIQVLSVDLCRAVAAAAGEMSCLLTSPGHCTHLLQMFDVSIASALKMQMKKELASSRFAGFLRTLNVSDFSLHKEMTREISSSMIASFLTACVRVCTWAACRQSFAVTGVAAYDPVRVLVSDDAVPPPRDGVLPRRTGKANTKWLTSKECPVRCLSRRMAASQPQKISCQILPRYSARSRQPHSIKVFRSAIHQIS